MSTYYINNIEIYNLLFLILNVQISNHECKSLVQLALEQRRLTFLNSERIWNIMQHQYRAGFLTPDQDLQPERESSELFHRLLFAPFQFYFTSQGYHWITAVLFMLYLAFVCVYAGFRPLSGSFDSRQMVAFELILWICNVGYIVFEGFEIRDKKKEYLNLGVKGQTNLMDVAICLVWIILGGIRLTLIIDNTTFEEGDIPTSTQNIYVFLFGLQIVLLTFRSLSLFSNTQYLGS
eukprot:431254_1